MRFLNGKELAGFVKERQAGQVRALRQAHAIEPKLAIVVTIDNPVTEAYLKLKVRYGTHILVHVDVHRVKQADIRELLDTLNKDRSVHGIIVQLPLEDRSETHEIVNLVATEKDVDGLSAGSEFDPATALSIMWLLSGYNIELNGKEVVLIGHGKLVGQPLEKLMLAAGVTPTIIDVNTPDPKGLALKADVIVTATGHHRVLTSDMIKQGAVVIDAGVASEGNKTVGDVAPEIYDERDDLTITPLKGGVGPLTVSALFDNVIRAAQRVAEQAKQPAQ
jgi:methylenetetrahydrofolate dehydrogenase (NADP+)/methenyltetrahydrofolate cyclohydrolase